ncbi:MAG: cupredoxin domain-containing protein [Myxococcota bacterium]
MFIRNVRKTSSSLFRPGRLLRAALWSSLLLIPSVAFAATVKGKVKGHNQLINPVWEEAARPGNNRYTWREPSPTVRSEFRRLFGLAPKELCIAGISSQKVEPPKVPILVTVGGGRTTPVTIVVAPGTRIRFRNNDPFKHRLYAVDEKSLPPADMAMAAERDWTAPGVGTYELRDELAPSLRSWVIVKEGVASIGYPNRKGEFFLTLEPGSYKLEFFFAGKTIGELKEVTVGTRDVDLTRQPIKVALPKDKDASDDAKK